MFCPKCGSKLEEGDIFCVHCGLKVPKQPAAEETVVITKSEIQKAEHKSYQTESKDRDYRRYRQENFEPEYEEEEWEEEPKKRSTVLIVGIIAGAVVLLAAMALVFFIVIKPRMDSKKQAEVPTETVTEQITTEEITETETEPETEADTEPAADYPKKRYTTAHSGLLLREGPGKNYKAIYLINYGTEISVEKEQNGWAYTTVAGLSGWCSCDYLTADKSELEKETTKAAGTIDPKKLVEPEHIVDYGYHGTVSAKSGLMFRYGPGTEYEAIDKIPYGTEVAEEGWSGDWIYIKYKGRYGWVNSNYIEATGGIAKPAIYLYPTHRLDVAVDVKLAEGSFIRTAPAYNNGWKVTAYPDGRIVDPATGKEYDYIYWESDSEPEYDWSEGYVVAGSDTREFLLEILPKMGLIPDEYNDFIDYWQPRMQNNRYNLITFQTTCYTDAAELVISPKPDSVLRVFMAYKAVDGPMEIKTPEISGFERKGFTVVEWGGAEVR